MNAATNYNEAFDDRGNARAAYRSFYTRTGHNPLWPSAEIAADLTNAPLGDRYAILPVPLVLDDREYRELIVTGVEQRALAMQALLFDLLTGDTRVFRNTSLPRDLFPIILEQEGLAIDHLASWWAGKTRESLRFTYGPDLVRDPEGRWRILEDNVGCVGGVVDAEFVVESFLQCTGTRLHAASGKACTLAQAVREFLARMERTPSSPDVVAVLEDECASSDPETHRKRRVLEGLGLRVLNRSQLAKAEEFGVRIRHVTAVVNFSLAGNAFDGTGAALMNAPGVAALGNKALLPFMDEIVAFYSSCDPILRAAETHVCRAIPVEASGWVLKRSNGCQGGDVFFLDAMSEAERRQLNARVAGWGRPECGVLQRHVSASFVQGGGEMQSPMFQVELRPFAFVIGDSQCVVGDHASGRAFRNADGRRLGNMSHGACYLSVIREPTAFAPASWEHGR